MTGLYMPSQVVFPRGSLELAFRNIAPKTQSNSLVLCAVPIKIVSQCKSLVAVFATVRLWMLFVVAAYGNQLGLNIFKNSRRTDLNCPRVGKEPEHLSHWISPLTWLSIRSLSVVAEQVGSMFPNRTTGVIKLLRKMGSKVVLAVDRVDCSLRGSDVLNTKYRFLGATTYC